MKSRRNIKSKKRKTRNRNKRTRKIGGQGVSPPKSLLGSLYNRAKRYITPSPVRVPKEPIVKPFPLEHTIDEINYYVNNSTTCKVKYIMNTEKSGWRNIQGNIVKLIRFEKNEDKSITQKHYLPRIPITSTIDEQINDPEVKWLTKDAYKLERIITTTNDRVIESTDIEENDGIKMYNDLVPTTSNTSIEPSNSN